MGIAPGWYGDGPGIAWGHRDGVEDVGMAQMAWRMAWRMEDGGCGEVEGI